jgi:hypothetical protein
MIDKSEPAFRKGVRTMVMIILLEIWKERNNYTFRGRIASTANILGAIKRDIYLWRQAGASCLEHSMGDNSE